MDMSGATDGCGTLMLWIGGILLLVFLAMGSEPQTSSNVQPNHRQTRAAIQTRTAVRPTKTPRDAEYTSIEDEAASIQVAEESQAAEDATVTASILTREAEINATRRASEAEAQQSSLSGSGAAYTTTNLNVRTGPSVNCPVLSSLNQNSTIIPIYCNADCSWLLLSGSGWVSAGYVANPPAGLSVYSNIPACAYAGSSLVAQPAPTVAQPAPTVARPSCGGGCTQQLSGCNIKGNVGYNSGERIYHVPGQAYYNDTVINSRYGERWFCTESEAQAAGWRRAYQ